MPWSSIRARKCRISPVFSGFHLFCAPARAAGRPAWPCHNRGPQNCKSPLVMLRLCQFLFRLKAPHFSLCRHASDHPNRALGRQVFRQTDPKMHPGGMEIFIILVFTLGFFTRFWVFLCLECNLACVEKGCPSPGLLSRGWVFCALLMWILPQRRPQDFGECHWGPPGAFGGTPGSPIQGGIPLGSRVFAAKAGRSTYPLREDPYPISIPLAMHALVCIPNGILMGC